MRKKISLILPSLIILVFIIIDSMIPESKNILVGIYLVFPIVFISQGLIYKDLISDLIIGFALSSLSVILPISIFYNMGSCIPAVIIYIILGLTSFFVKRKISSNR